MKQQKLFSLVLLATFMFGTAVLESCEKHIPEVTPSGNEEVEIPDSTDKDDAADVLKIKTVSPADGETLDLDRYMGKSITFEWQNLDTIPKYKIKISLNKDLSEGKVFALDSNPYAFDAFALDKRLLELGVATDADVTLYWQIQSAAVAKAESDINVLNVSRMSYGYNVPANERKAETIVRKVAVLVEDPVIPSTGKRIHETVFASWGYAWNDPWVQMKEFERDMEASSHNVVDYEIVEVIDSDRFFSYHRGSVGSNYEYMTLDTLVNYYFPNRTVDGVATYDYVGMMKHYGFDKKVDNDELHEVWVYTHPACGMYESRLIGEGAFWCNSPGIGVPEASNSKLCCVMFCNYERTTDLAMHSYAHRVESIMSQVYENYWNGWHYEDKTSKSQLTNWEKFSAHEMEYKKYEDKHAHIGLCHFPPNSEGDYDYGNTRYVYTYADSWQYYPYLIDENPRKVNRTEWQDAGGDQWGYMKWYFSHIPYFKGLNTTPSDRHLNNWWYYIVDYHNAIKEERRLRNEILN